MISIIKPALEDIVKIREILLQWTEKEEAEKYIERIENELNGRSEFNMQFWVSREENVLGVTGLSDPLPKILHFAESDNPLEIKILYVDKESQGKGVGKSLINFLEDQVINSGRRELLVRSAMRYKETAWGFYKKMGYEEVGEIPGDQGKEMMQIFRKVIY